MNRGLNVMPVPLAILRQDQIAEPIIKVASRLPRAFHVEQLSSELGAFHVELQKNGRLLLFALSTQTLLHLLRLSLIL
jgi:hypothetical protein